MSELIYPKESYDIIGICMEVHRLLGSGLLEVVYKDALEYEFRKKAVLYEREKEYLIRYKDVILPHRFFADFVVLDKIILEVKAVSSIQNESIARAINYLKISGNRLGLVVNFGTDELIYKRVVFYFSA
jgi:GxxExxY protein